jgi:hypothetical protein
MRKRLAIAAMLMCSGTFVAMATAAPNDFVVVSPTNAPGLQEGQMFERGARISIPEGASVTLTDRTSGNIRSVTCIGKYEGPIENCPKASARNTTVIPGAHRNKQD